MFCPNDYFTREKYIKTNISSKLKLLFILSLK